MRKIIMVLCFFVVASLAVYYAIKGKQASMLYSIAASIDVANANPEHFVDEFFVAEFTITATSH